MQLTIGSPYIHTPKFDDKEAGEIIFQQLRSSHKRRLMLACWGARNFINMRDGLKFKVSGRKFQGYVYIIYDKTWDLYDILFGKIQNHEWILKAFETMVYDDNFVEIIDRIVETD